MSIQALPTESASSPLDAYDIPVENFLVEKLREGGHDPSELSPIIDSAIKEAKKQIEKKSPVYLPNILLARIEEQAYSYIQAVLSQSKKFKGILERIRSYDSVFLVGAGISFESGVPLLRILGDILRFCEAEDYAELNRSEEKCLKFKKEFRAICERKKPGTSHRLIVKNFPLHIKEVICLNWDNLIEKSALETNGSPIRKMSEDSSINQKNYLWKFHGDVENIKDDNQKGKGGWVFPGEEGFIFTHFLNYVETCEDLKHIFTFVIVGYSELEKEVCDKIIKSFESQPPRPTYRVGLDLARLHDSNYAVGPSDYVLQKILPLQS